MMVWIVLIWFIFTVLQESGYLDLYSLFVEKKKINKISQLFSRLQPPPPFLVKSQLFLFICLPFPYWLAYLHHRYKVVNNLYTLIKPICKSG